MAIGSFSPNYTYQPGKPPAQNNWEANENYSKGEGVRQKAQATADFFAGADNTELDADPRAGYVRLKNAPAPGLLESGNGDWATGTVTGFRTPDGNLQAESQNQSGTPSSMLSIHGDEVTMDRPAYVNDRYMPTLETLRTNADGTYTFSMTYHDHYR